MSFPLVSVVIATRDRPEMVREAIAAALQQDYRGPIEVLVVFDQSEPDVSLEESGVERSVRVLRNIGKPGLAGGRNSGIEASAGEYVAFCDDDDLWLPSKIRAQVAALAAVPEAGMCTTGIRVQYDGDEFDRSLETDRVTFDDLLRDRHTELHPSTFLLRRSVLASVIGPVDENVPGGFGEDYEFLLRTSKAHPIVNVPKPLAVIRWGNQSFFFRRWETMSDGLSWLLERYPEFETSPRGSARMHGQIAFAQAAMGNRREGLRWARQSLRRSAREPRAYLAAAVAIGAVRPATIMETLHKRGKGI